MTMKPLKDATPSWVHPALWLCVAIVIAPWLVGGSPDHWSWWHSAITIIILVSGWVFVGWLHIEYPPYDGSEY